MEIALLAARLVLAAVFTIAGVAKLFDLRGSRDAMRGFGVPERLAAPLGTLLPVAELAIGILLIPLATAWWAALAAVLVLVLFIAGIVRAMAQGQAPECHCFGQLHSEPAGRRTLARNVVLVAIAGFIVWQGRDDAGLSVAGWADGMTATERWLAAIASLALAGVIAEGWLLVQLMSQHGRLLIRLDEMQARTASGQPAAATASQRSIQPTPGLPIGAPAPTFQLPSLDGTEVSLADLQGRGNDIVLVFSDAGCGACTALLPKIDRWQREHAALTVALVSSGPPDTIRAKIAEHGVRNVLLDSDRAVAFSFRARGTPSAVLLRANGTVGSHIAFGPDAIEALLAEVLRSPSNGATGGLIHAGTQPQGPSPLPIGTPAPALRLPDTEGRTVDLAGFRGRPVLVLFWDVACGYCARMLPDLQAWERTKGEDAPQLLVVSIGSAEANRALGLRAPVLLATGRTAGMAFGVRGTPGAVLVDAEGRIASEVATGAPSIWRLVQGTAPIGASPA